MEWLEISLVGLQAGSQKTAEIRLFPLYSYGVAVYPGRHFISFWRLPTFLSSTKRLKQ